MIRDYHWNDQGLSTASVCQVIGETGWQGSQESVETPTGSFTFHQNCPHLPHLPRLVTRQLTLFALRSRSIQSWENPRFNSWCFRHRAAETNDQLTTATTATYPFDPYQQPTLFSHPGKQRLQHPPCWLEHQLCWMEPVPSDKHLEQMNAAVERASLQRFHKELKYDTNKQTKDDLLITCLTYLNMLGLQASSGDLELSPAEQEWWLVM